MNIYEKMAKIIETRGKSWKVMVDANGACCMIGAYALARGYKLPIPDEGGFYANNEDRSFVESLYDEFNNDPDFVNLSLKIRGRGSPYEGFDPGPAVYLFSDNHNQDEVIDFLRKL